LREEPCTDPYARFCGQTGAAAPSDPTSSIPGLVAAVGRLPETSHVASTQARCASSVAANQGRGPLRRGREAAPTRGTGFAEAWRSSPWTRCSASWLSCPWERRPRRDGASSRDIHVASTQARCASSVAANQGRGPLRRGHEAAPTRGTGFGEAMAPVAFANVQVRRSANRPTFR